MKRTEQLDWLCRNVQPSDWHEDKNMLACVKCGMDSETYVSFPSACHPDYGFTHTEYLARRAELQGKPSWSDAPEINGEPAQWLWQNKNGEWVFATGDTPQAQDWYYVSGVHKSSGRLGEVLGDWQYTLERRPDHIEQDFDTVDENKKYQDAVKSLVGEDTKPVHPDDMVPEFEGPIRGFSSGGMSAKYPKYYKDVSSLSEIDVYQVHELFGVKDDSGCLQHSSKKILLSGARNGGKSLEQDIREARDTLTRKLQIMGVEQ